MDTVYKILENCEVKKVGERQYEFTASTSDVDRDGEVIDVTGWDLKNFKKNPVIMFGHDYRSLPVGKATKIGVKDSKLVNTVEFPPEGTYEFADTVERLVNTGYLKTESVGFIPQKWEDGDGDKDPRRTYTKQELLEISIVPVPSNPNALMNAVKEGVITTKQFKSITKSKEINEYIKSLDFDDELNKGKLRNYFWDMLDTFVSCFFSIVYEGDGLDKVKSIKKLLKEFNSSFTEWAEIANEAGVLSNDSPPDIIVMSLKEYLSKGKFNSEKIGQGGIIDEIDYLKSIIEKEGLSEEGKESFEDLMRVSGYDNPVNIADVPSEQTVSDSETNSAFIETLGEIIKEQLEVK